MTAGLEFVGATIVDLIVGETFRGALGELMERRARQARQIIVAELQKGKPWAITKDKAAAALFTYIRAAQEGAARVNLKMMAEALVNAAQEPTFAPDEFRRQGRGTRQSLPR